MLVCLASEVELRPPRASTFHIGMRQPQRHELRLHVSLTVQRRSDGKGGATCLSRRSYLLDLSGYATTFWCNETCKLLSKIRSNSPKENAHVTRRCLGYACALECTVLVQVMRGYTVVRRSERANKNGFEEGGTEFGISFRILFILSSLFTRSHQISPVVFLCEHAICHMSDFPTKPQTQNHRYVAVPLEHSA